MGAKYGFLIPDSYVREVPDHVDMNTSSIFWGFSLAAAMFAASKAAKQSQQSWQRSKRVTVYVLMLWGVWASSVVLGVLSWGFQRQYIGPSFAFFFCIVLFWAIQVQLLLQIIINRLDLLIVVPGRATRLKWLLFVIILALNISVFVIWMPARLQISDKWVHLNLIWDRCEKIIFAIVDGGLNGYFIFLVRARINNDGLTKYVGLYRTNLVLIGISLSLDVVLVGLVSLNSKLIYLSFQPVCYLLKLQIEMTMADLITKVVRSSGGNGGDDVYYRHSSGGKSRSDGTAGKSTFSNTLSKGHNATFRGGNTTQVGVGDHDSEIELEVREGANASALENGIMKTVQTTVASTPAEDRDDGDADSTNSSTMKLHYRSIHQY
ncbi:hypothetical protein G7Z17_g2504 [Cylindrodendrum hubeiense]|uniref:Transmembrane protein n=1 Tax=Cylindrodendrum hubeiense TaxID=595255 RepID=A0A9P5LJ20_9HYPO|nr:hypothetical protein G7Z17_g2504 [Cylindrodendrum hubeiense]